MNFCLVDGGFRIGLYPKGLYQSSITECLNKIRVHVQIEHPQEEMVKVSWLQSDTML